MRRHQLAFLLAGLIVLLAVPHAAGAAQRYAAPDGTGTVCTSLTPCSLTAAVSGAVVGADVVIVTAGNYAVASSLAIDGLAVSGATGARPVLQGSADLLGSTVVADKGARVSDLEITAAAPSQDALSVKGASVVERVIARSSTGDGVKVVADVTGPSVLRDSVVATASGTAGTAGVKLRGTSGTLALRNVTVEAPQGSAVGIRCETRSPGSASIVNVVARGSSANISVGTSGGEQCTADTSLTPSSPGNTGILQGSVQTVADLMLGTDLRPRAGSPVIDAGASDALVGGYDLDGAARSAGTPIDAGAYEFGAAAGKVPDPEPVPAPATTGTGAGTATGTPATTSPTTTGTAAAPTAGEPTAAPAEATVAPAAPAIAAPPRLGRTIVLGERSGEVLVRLPGTTTYVPIDAAENLPVGTVVDARDGAVTLRSALAGGGTQTGTFSGGRFEVRQDRAGRGMTDIVLRGGSFRGCRPAARSASAGLVGRVRAFAAARSRRKRPVRRLWARDRGGRFRTHGANSVATVRGTRWLTEDRCDGTLTRVVEGAVDVRAKGAAKATRVRAGRSVLVRRRAR